MKKIVNLFFISLMLLSFTTINCSLATTNDETFFVTSNENNDSFSFLMTDISTQETTEVKIPNISNQATDDENYTGIEACIPKDTNSSYNLFNNSLISPSKVFDDDTRVKVNTSAYPYSAIGYLRITFKNSTETYRGTAFLIGDNIAVTAGHCAYSFEKGEASSITFIPGRDGSNYPFGSANATKYAVKSEYKNGDGNYDWAILVLDSNIGNSAGTIGFGKYNNFEDCLGKGAVISGYPKDKSGYQQYGANGYITSVSEHKMWYTIDTYDGQSGSPIMNSDKKAFGVHTGGSKENGNNWGMRVNDEFYSLAQYAVNNY